jgi:hypothetical protein
LTDLAEAENQELYHPDNNIGIHLLWAAPELVVVEKGRAAIVSTQNDIFSFGRVMLQVSALTFL